MKFLTTTGLNYHLEDLLKQAEQELLLVTPYVKLHKKLRDILASQKMKGVKITFVCRKGDLKDSLADCADRVVDAPLLHAKCYLSEREAMVCSLNLYEFSQVNNDEMGIIVENSGADAALYREVLQEAKRLANLGGRPAGLVEGKMYSHDELNAYFAFAFAGGAGIKKASSGALVLFNMKPEKNPEKDGFVDFCGQPTGDPEMGLKYGNKLLYDCWHDQTKVIHMFKQMIYMGRYRVAKRPEQNEKGEWRFQLCKV